MQTFSINYLNKMAEEVRREGLDAILIAPSEDLLFITGHNPIFCRACLSRQTVNISTSATC